MTRVTIHAIVALLALCAATPAPADGPVLQAVPRLSFGRQGYVFAVVPLPDGSVIVGGDFTQIYDPATDTATPRRNLAKFSASGQLDAGFDPSPGGTVIALALGPAGSLYVGGSFNLVGVEPRRSLAKVSATDGTLDPNWVPFVDSTVYSLAVDATGAVFAGGDFVTIGGLLRSRLAKLSGTGAGLGDADWQQDANGIVRTLAVDGTSLYAGGEFTTLGSSGRSYLAKLNTNGAGTVDSNWNPAPNAEVYALAVDGGGVVFAGGRFSFIGGQARNCCLARLVGATGTSDTTWTYGLADSTVFTLARDSSFLYAGGAFTTINGLARRSVARLAKSTGGLNDAGFDADVDDFVYAVAHDALDPALYVGGVMRSASGAPAAGLVRVGDFTGQAIKRYFVEYPGNVAAIAPTPDGGTLIAGGFTRVTNAGAPTAASNIIKLDAQYLLAPWAGTTDDYVYALVADAAGNVYAGGQFQHAGNVPRARLAKFDQAGAVDATWNPAPDALVSGLALAPGASSIYAAGFFANVGGQPRAGLAKIAATGVGVADAVWNPAPDSPLSALAVATTGAVYVGGSFQSIGGQQRRNLARLSGTGTGAADPAWNPSPDAPVDALLLDPAGDIVVGGSFASLGATTTGPIAKLSPANGTAVPGWGAGLVGPVTALARDATGSYFASRSGALARIAPGGDVDQSWSPALDGEVAALVARGADLIVGGSFANVAGQPRERIAVFRDDVLLRNGFE